MTIKNTPMKRNACILIGLALTIISIGQDQITSPVFMAEKATWLGPEVKTINDYLESTAIYPEAAKKERKVGTEVVEFVVTAEGELTNFHVINSVSDDIDKEMIRVLKETQGMWKPGLINGEAAPLKKEVYLTFVPNDSYNLVEMAKNNVDQGNEKLFVDKDPKGALEFYNQAVVLLPYEKDIMAVRSLCKYEMGDKQGAREDWERIVNMGMGDTQQLETGIMIIKMQELDGYDELAKFIN